MKKCFFYSLDPDVGYTIQASDNGQKLQPEVPWEFAMNLTREYGMRTLYLGPAAVLKVPKPWKAEMVKSLAGRTEGPYVKLGGAEPGEILRLYAQVWS